MQPRSKIESREKNKKLSKLVEINSGESHEEINILATPLPIPLSNRNII